MAPAFNLNYFIMISDEEIYLRSRLTWFDKVCRNFYWVPVTAFFVLVGFGLYLDHLGVPPYRILRYSIMYWSLVTFVFGLFIYIVLKTMVYNKRVDQYRMEYYVKTRKS